MTIKQQGGIFGRNPTFNDLTVEGTLTTSGTQTVDALNVTNNLDVDGVITTDGLTVNATTTTLEGSADQILQLRTTNSSADNRIYFGRTGEDTRGIIYFQHNGGKLRYDVDSNHIFTVTNASGLAMQRNVSFTAGQGIDFSATSGTGTSELFSDYEEGNWTPVPNSFINYTPSVQIGRYTKVGNLVTASFNLSWTSANAGSNQFVVSGLPFTSSSTSNYASAAAIGGSDYLTASVQVFGHIQSNTTAVKFFTMNSGSTKSNLLCSSWNASGSTNNIVGTVSYIV